MSRACDAIRQSVNCLLAHNSFQQWLAKETPGPGDYILVNNSFVFRDVKTKKSEYYLCLVVDNSGNVPPDPKIATGVSLNSDLKRFSGRSKNLPTLTDLDQAVSQEMAKIGQIVFLLIGEVKDTVITEAVGHTAFSSIKWDPSSRQPFIVSGNEIIVSEIYDEEKIWSAIEQYFRSSGRGVPEGLREAIGLALDQLQDKAIAEVEIPAFGTTPGEGITITDAIVKVLEDQRKQYERVLNQYLSSRDTSLFNEILRISYNFASDATSYIRLIVSICDLKPVVLWGTIAEHYALSEAFRNLPWTRSRNKPSLENYERTVADARNSAFHHLFPFRKTLRVPLPSTALQGAELRIFSEHTRKKENRLRYPDEELVDILKEFTRAREQRPSERFWQQNLHVMDATIALFRRTSDFIKVLHSEISAVP